MEIFRDGLVKLGLNENIDYESFETFKELLLEWNEKINITRITSEDEVYTKHFIDSLSIFLLDIFNGDENVMDLGTGGGFPGMPMKLYMPGLNITLMDSLKKRLNFLDIVIEKLGLIGISTLHGRAEELARNIDYRESFQIVTSRAVAELSTLLEFSMGFVKVGGYFVAMKGPKAEEELIGAKNALKILKSEVVKVEKIKIDDFERNLILIKKVGELSSKYPRGGGKPKKNPL